jgi:hypothetical protein
VTLSDLMAGCSFGVALAAVVVAIYTVWRGSLNTSAGTLVTLNGGLQEGWRRFLCGQTPEARSYEFAELMNLLELSAAIFDEKSLVGVSRKLMEEYLCRTLSLLEQSPKARNDIAALRHSPDTFEYLKRFLVEAKASGKYKRFTVALGVQAESELPPEEPSAEIATTD